MAFLGAVAAGAAGDVSCGKEPSAVRVKGEVVGGAVRQRMQRIGLVGFPEGELGAAVENLGVAGEGGGVEKA